ncbi:hypothetical protein [Amycolatopsis sp. TNS106]|uniref:hypothetical protein n=1 Tax=Amycolatopsis sp. TNS106 TaxID=2861750 RepID=UPI001C56D692|nr:hypothetical protein [Amycolatopsis sp. TNS106]QXV63544.1 hypothetical protein CVV72_41010 [Amycolatopsis sp. TNS106]
MSDDVLAVVGWLTLTLQAGSGDRAPLGAADQVAVTMLAPELHDQFRKHRTKGWDGPLVQVLWRGGPLAGTVADKLAAAADPPWPVTIQPRPDTDTHSDVVVGPVLVMLYAVDADPDDTAVTVSARRPLRWEDPLMRDGATRAVTVRQPDPAPGTIAAAVLHHPIAQWPPRGRLVAEPQHEMPSWVGAERDIAFTNALLDAQIRLNTAEPGTTVDDARRIADSDVARAGKNGGASAVLLPDQRVYVQIITSPLAAGVEVIAELEDSAPPPSTGKTPDEFLNASIVQLQLKTWPGRAWTYLPTALMDVLTTFDGPPPDRIVLRPLTPLFDGADAVYRLAITETPPKIPLDMQRHFRPGPGSFGDVPLNPPTWPTRAVWPVPPPRPGRRPPRSPTTSRPADPTDEPGNAPPHRPLWSPRRPVPL